MMLRRILATCVLLVATGCSESVDIIEPPPPPPLGTQSVLVLADGEGVRGSSAQLALSLENPIDLAALQFDFSFNPSVVTSVTVTPTTRTAGFEVQSNTVGATTHVVLIDLAADAVLAPGNGAVANVTVNIAGSAPLGASTLLVDAATAVDLTITTLAVGGSSAILTVR